MSSLNFMLSWVEHERSFITSGPRLINPKSANLNCDEQKFCDFFLCFVGKKAWHFCESSASRQHAWNINSYLMSQSRDIIWKCHLQIFRGILGVNSTKLIFLLIHGHRSFTRHIGPGSAHFPEGLLKFRPEKIWSARPICLVMWRWHVTCMSLRCCDVTVVIKDVEGACRGQYGCTRGLIWIHVSGLWGVWNHEQNQPE